MKRRFTIYDLRFTICRKSASAAAVNHQSSIINHQSQRGVALIITVILLAVVTFMALTFLAVSRRERGAVTTTTDTATARLAADDALASAEAQIVANVMATTNPYNFGLLVSTNYINTNGFVPGNASYTNVNYNYRSVFGNGPVFANADPKDFLQLLANLYYLPRPPVFVPSPPDDYANPTNYDFRFYLDLNRNARFDTNGLVGDFDNNGNYLGNISEVGDPEWIGVLQHPDQPYGPNNPFVARYAFVAVPIGNALDLNAIYNDAREIYPNARTTMAPGNDGFMRNQGVGSWEINLAAFLADLNTNQWLPVFPPDNGYYAYNEPRNLDRGLAFDDALSLLCYRYDYYADNSYNLSSVDQLYGGVNGPGDIAFRNDNIDGYSDGPLQTGFQSPGDSTAPLNDNPALPWSGADNTNQFFDPQELFNSSETAIAVAPGSRNFTSRLLDAGDAVSTYNRYTYYRLLSQMGVDSAPEQDKINLNYSNAAAYFDADGVVTNITYYPGAETNFTQWTPLQFFTIAADRMLRTYSQEWLTENPSNYLATYEMTTNIGTLADPTNVPIPFGITDIPVLVSNQFVYTPAIQRVLQLAANIYDATTNNTAVMGMDFPSVFRPIFNLVPVVSPAGDTVYTNVYIAGYEPVESFVNGIEQMGTVIGGTNNYQLEPPVTVANLQDPNYEIPYYGYSGPFGSGIYTNVNVFGVPWIIGAKKGFPNFNEFAMESVFQLTRKLQVTRRNISDTYVNNPGDYSFNQMFNLSLTNQLAVECWNSYSNFYQSPNGQPRSVAMYVDDNLSVTLTNDEYLGYGGLGYTTNFLITSSLQVPNAGLTAWPGYNLTAYPLSTPASFQIPLYTNVSVIPTAMYRFNVGNTVAEPGYVGGHPYLTTNLNAPYESGVTLNGQIYPQPHWGLITSNNVRVIMLDTTDPNLPQVIDYVQLAGPNSVRDLSYEIMTNYDVPFNSAQASGNELWNTNIINGVPIGVTSQIGVSDGTIQVGTTSGPWAPTDPTQLANEVAGFTAFMGYAPNPPLTAGEINAVALAQASLSNQAPYTPMATMVQVADWQVNDPLVHYLAGDIDQPGVEPSFEAPPPTAPMPTLTNTTYATIGQLNTRYMPWGGHQRINPSAPDFNTLNAYNLALKDPLVWRSDDWDFPTYKMPTVGWLGRVHRGTPWQTVYLKSPNILEQTNSSGAVIGTNTWVQWTGDSSFVLASHQYYDAINSAPVQDRLLFDLFTTAFNDNATRGTLSVNVGASDPSNPQAGLAAWSALLSGVEVVSNNAVDAAISPSVIVQQNGSLPDFTAFPINPAGPGGENTALGLIVTNINATRTNFVNVDGLAGTFEHAGDVLAAPALSVESPFLNWNDTAQQINGISDEMYEWLPQQVMSLLRVSGTPQSPMRYVIYCYGQALKPAPNGIYTGSQSINTGNGQSESAFGMVTNYQIVAESATRTVVNFGSVVTNVVSTNDDLGNVYLLPHGMPVVTNNNAQIEQFNVLPSD
jgi:hypothetical protein